MTFGTVPGHALHPGTISFSAASAGPSSIRFSIDIAGDFAGPVWAALYAIGGTFFENGVWKNLLNNVATYCGSSR